MTTLAVINEQASVADLTAAWLGSFRESAHTRGAYKRDLETYLRWCDRHDLDPTHATRPVLDAFLAELANTINSRTGQAFAPSSIARRLSAVSSWYDYLVSYGSATMNPAKHVRRPKVDKDHTTTVGLSVVEARAFLAAASSGDRWLGETGPVLGEFLVAIGARVAEVCAAEVTDLGHDSGHRTVKLRMKGGKTRTRAIPPATSARLDAYLAARTDGPLFLNSAGVRLNRQEVARFVTRTAKAAGIPSADKVTPHSFRHAWATIARERGASLEERQFALGHADPRTTQRYDRARQNLDRDPSYLVIAAMAD